MAYLSDTVDAFCSATLSINFVTAVPQMVTRLGRDLICIIGRGRELLEIEILNAFDNQHSDSFTIARTDGSGRQVRLEYYPDVDILHVYFAKGNVGSTIVLPGSLKYVGQTLIGLDIKIALDAHGEMPFILPNFTPIQETIRRNVGLA